MIIQNSLKDIIISKNNQEIEKKIALIHKSEDEISQIFGIIYQRFLGKIEDIRKTHRAFNQWKPIREEIISLARTGKKEKAIEILKNKNASHVEFMHAQIQYMVDFANYKGITFYGKSLKARKTAFFTFSFIIIIILILGFCIAYIVGANILRLEKNIVVQSEKLTNINQELEKAKSETIQALKKEQELSKLRSYFISIASHQFRTPLTTIQSSIEIIFMYLSDIGSEFEVKLEKHFKKVFTEIQNLDSLMNDILLLGKVDVGKTLFYPIETDIKEFFDSILDQTTFPSQGKRKVIFSEEGKKHLIPIDHKLMNHAIFNILSNAFKYSTGNPEIHIQYEEKEVLVIIKDDGIGIPEEASKYIFETFYRANNAVHYKGTGLGLAIAKEFINQHNGTIEFKSELNKGTEFWIRLPKYIQAKNHKLSSQEFLA